MSTCCYAQGELGTDSQAVCANPPPNEFTIWFDRLHVFIFACDVRHIKLE